MCAQGTDSYSASRQDGWCLLPLHIANHIPGWWPDHHTTVQHDRLWPGMAHAATIATLVGQEVHLEVKVGVEKNKRGFVGSIWKPTYVCSGIELRWRGGLKVKSEATSPRIKEESITLKLEYPLPPVSPNPNNYHWGSQEIWNRTNKHCTLYHSIRHLASASASPFQANKRATETWASGICLCKPLPDHTLFPTKGNGYQKIKHFNLNRSKLGELRDSYTVCHANSGLLWHFEERTIREITPNIWHTTETNRSITSRCRQMHCHHGNMEQKELDGIGPSSRHHVPNNLAWFQ